MLSGDMFEASFLHEGEENPERIFFREAVWLPSIIVQSFIQIKGVALGRSEVQRWEKMASVMTLAPRSGVLREPNMLKIGTALDEDWF